MFQMTVYRILSGYDHELYLNKTSLCSGILLFDKGCFSNSSNACSFTTECPSLTAKLSRAVELLNKLKYAIYYSAQSQYSYGNYEAIFWGFFEKCF